MKTGRDLNELAQALMDQKPLKRDFVADTTSIKAITVPLAEKDKVILTLPDPKDEGLQVMVEPTRHCVQQMASWAKVPWQYMDRMMTEAPKLAVVNINHWLMNTPAMRLLRTLGGGVDTARAFLSNKYRPLDNFDLAEVALPIMEEKGCQVQSCELTETRMYIKAVTPRVQAEVVGEVLQAGVVVSNSEVGAGSVRVEPLLFTLACLNGMIRQDHSMRKYHVGRGHEGGDGVQEFFSDDTRKQDDKALWMKVKDVVNGAMDEVKFREACKKLEKTAENSIDRDPVKVVEVVAQRFGLTEDEQGGVLSHLCQGGKMNQYGLLNAVTRMSQDVKDYERATDLERLGSTVMELSQRDWDDLAGKKPEDKTVVSV